LDSPSNPRIEIEHLPNDTRPRQGFYICSKDLEANWRFVLHPGEQTYPLDARTDAMSLEGC
jgi:hypothetical protein